ANEDGSFAEPVKRYTYLKLTHPQIADVNGDAKADIVCLAAGVRDSRVTVLFGDGAGRFPGVSHFSVPLMTDNGQANPREFRIADFHANGSNEIAVAAADHIFMLSAVGGRLQELARIAVPAQENFVGAIFTARMRPGAAPELIARGQSGPEHRYQYNMRVVLAEGEADAFAAPAKPRGRVRAVRGLEDLAVGTYDVKIESACPANLSTTWTIRREGIFVEFDPILGVVGVDAAYIDGEVLARVYVLDNGRLRTLDGSLYSQKSSMKAIFTESDPPCGQTWVAHLVEGTRR
ncbi:MAG TPA: VCBS repeat-containing protein, partial [Thermoanaerobaculia bacterium]|nr:VCBS repeat-containing protein [Thermoanaerobaculia bacterium]